MSSSIIKQAEKYCDDHGLRFTQTRELVLAAIANADKPITAYQILDALKGDVKNPKPPIVYRATDFWQEHGFVHKIESLNAFMVCGEDHQHTGSQFMICDGCGDVEELHLCSVPASIQKQADEKGFQAGFWNLELHGVCAKCR